MIIKSFELTKIDLNKNKFFLFYGQNEGHKTQVIEEKFKKFFKENIYFYEENEIIKNEENFFNEILSKSFFENEKLIIITRATDKLRDIIEEILEKKIEDIIIILNAGTLEKKSKLRSLFEKNKDIVCIPFYEDNDQTLSSIIIKFFNDNKIPISQQSVNFIVQRCRGNRLNLKNELEKIQSFIKNKPKVNIQDIIKLTNLSENYSANELIDSCLSKNKKKTIHILNENNYSLDDCILIIRTFLIKSKRLLKLSEMTKTKGNIDEVITSFKPPIFWKDKEIVKMQVKNWSQINLENLIFKINDTELLIKKNSTSAINILSNFIIEQTTSASN
tara:strand:- start:2326 stop:3321 length:996 start_codon:yes stop_codon:yes gene_type:complete